MKLVLAYVGKSHVHVGHDISGEDDSEGSVYIHLFRSIDGTSKNP
jgi:hypothetical protein